MFRKLLTILGIGLSNASAAESVPPFSPFENPAANTIYNLLFCDDLSAFRAKAGQSQTSWQAILFGDPASMADLKALAADLSQEGRIRYLAFARLREFGVPVQPKVLLGVVVEVHFDIGLDAIAAFSEGGVRYVNHSGKLVVVEGVATFRPIVERLFSASEPVVAQIGVWQKARRPPPSVESVRLTFLLSDGLTFGEGPLPVMQQDPMAGPILSEAHELMRAVFALSAEK